MNKIIACSIMKDEILTIVKDDQNITFLEYGLHRTPDKLNQELQKNINNTDKQYTHLLLGYGLCSNGALGLSSEHMTLIIPRVHDCISLLLGSKKLYDDQFTQTPGTIYLSKGWIDSAADPLSCLKTYTERVGQENALWALKEEYKNYQRLIFINTQLQQDLKDYRAYARQNADFLGLEYGEITGKLDLIKALVLGNWQADFLQVPPGKMVVRNGFI